MPAVHAQAYEHLLEWMHGRALDAWDIPSLQKDLVGKLATLGISLLRMHIGIPVLHPLYAAGAYTWTPEGGVETDLFGRDASQQAYWRQSPLRPIYESGADEGRIAISAEGASEFPTLRAAQEHGATEYFAQLAGFPDRSIPIERQEGVVLSWISNALGGFREDDLALLRRLRLPLCAQLKHLTDRRLVEDVLDAYLGAYSGKRVLSGQIQRGDGELIDAVIFFCDLRNSSTLAEQHDYRGFLEILNQYYEVTVEPVVAHGGEVLRFIGDASLAIFPFERFADPGAACNAALSSAIEAVRRGHRLNETRRSRDEVEIGFGIGLHPGTVMYGNIGIPSRLEFTVIGRAANEAARIESQCRELGEPILVSRDFVELLPGEWRSHGTFALRNIHEPIEILSPDVSTDKRWLAPC